MRGAAETTGPLRVLVCYDGSPGAEYAIERAARLFPGAHATVAYAWRRPVLYAGGLTYDQVVIPAALQEEVERHTSGHAEELVARGAEHARHAGLAAEARSYETDQAIWRGLLGLAEDVDADVIVAGSRGFGEVKSLLLGSTSAALVHHSERPVLVTPAD